MAAGEPNRLPGSPEPAGARLDSWKEIAAHFRRDVRTVQRWEKQEGLPVRRHVHQMRVSVYADRLELDTWWTNRQSRLEGEPFASADTIPISSVLGHRQIWGRAGAAVAIAAIAGTVAWLSRPAKVEPRAAIRVVPLTSYPGIEDFPSFSPDGKQVAFSWQQKKEDNFDIYVKTIGEDVPRRLTENPAEDLEPVWSPDGRRIAFLRAAGQFARFFKAKFELMVIPSSGGPQRKIADIHLEGPLRSHLAWTPDSKSLVVVDRLDTLAGPARHALFVISVADGQRRQIFDPPLRHFADSSPAISPDGRMLAFARLPGSAADSQIWLLELSNDFRARGEPKQLTLEKAAISNLAWTADGREIFYRAVRDGAAGLWRIFVNERKQARFVLNLPSGRHMGVAISRLGDRAAYTGGYEPLHLWEAKLAAGKAVNPVQFTSSTWGEANARFSPDGKRIAFGSSRSGTAEIWVSESDGSNPRQRTFLRGFSGTPRWSANGREIAFDSSASGNGDIWIVSAAGGTPPRRLTTDPATDDSPSWSRDGRWVYFASNRSGEFQVWQIPPGGGNAVQLTRNGGFGGFESPDGRFFYYAKGFQNASLWQVPVEGGEEVQLPIRAKESLDFDVTKKGIYFVPPGDQTLRFQLYTFAKGRTQTLGEIESGRCLGVSVSPDESRILFSASVGSPSNVDLMLAENLPQR